MWAGYLRALHAHPLKTKCVTSAILTGGSDLGVQAYERHQQQLTIEAVRTKHGPDTPVNLQNGCPTHVGYVQKDAQEGASTSAQDWWRTGTLSSVGLLYSGPVNHFWFLLLERMVTFTGPRAVVAKMALDQLFFLPVCIGGYFVSRGLMEGRPLDPEILRKLKLKHTDAVVAAWGFWPLVSAASFALVPLNLRVLFGSFCGFFWSARLSVSWSGPLVPLVPPNPTDRTGWDHVAA